MQRNYNFALPHNKIPDALCQLPKKVAAPAMPLEEEFKTEAAIVNYFGSGDMLGAPLDDMEANRSKPIVSISLGCEAIFLLGGKSREDEPLTMFLRSGDIVLMAGEVRECFDGIRVLVLVLCTQLTFIHHGSTLVCLMVAGISCGMILRCSESYSSDS